MMAQGSGPEHRTNDKDAPPIQLRSRTFIPEPGIDSALDIQALAQSSDRAHVLVQLWSIPDENELAAVQAAGLRLLSYIPHNAWLASISIEVDLLASPFSLVRWIGPLLPTDKLSPTIRAHGVGSWAVAQDGRVLLDLLFFDDVSANEAMQAIARHDGQIQEEIGDFHRYVVWFPADAVSALATEDTVMWIDSGPPPKVALNDGARAATNVDAVQAGGLGGSNVDLGIWDGGIVGIHVDFAGRLTVVDTGATADDHATHVAGTMAGDGSNSINHGGTDLQWRGMAPAADIFSYNWDNNITDHDGAINTHGIELSQNSWGYVVEEAPPYENCDLFGDYMSDSSEYDDIVTGKYGKRIVVVFAAGNDRNDGDCGMSSTPPYVNYSNITPPGGTAKNVITVGAANSDDDSMTDFSDWGPVDDGRVKPDVVAPGCESTGEGYIHSTLPGNTYGAPGWCGTSMAAPVVSGISALLIEQYSTTFGSDPLPSTVKALLIHTAEDLDDGTSWYNPGPDYASGYGRVDAQAAVNAIVAEEVQENQILHDQTITHSIELSQTTGSLRMTLVWDDPPASVPAGPTLVNNLDLELVEPNGTTIHYPWVLDPANPANNATTGVDSVNNVEQVYVTDPVTGTWTVRVKGTNVPQGPQRYSLAGSASGGSGPSPDEFVYLPAVLRSYPPLPGSLTSVADACVLQGYPTANFGDTIDMWAGYDDYLNPDGKIARSLIKFDISSVPSGSSITNVALRVFMCESWDYPGRSRTITAYRIGSNWSESTVTWNSRPSCAEVYGSVAITHGSFDWYSFNVTNLVKAWVNGTYPNYGVMLRGPEHSGSDSSWRAFRTRETSYDPELVITYASGLSVRYALSSEADSDSAASLTIMDLFGISPDQGATPMNGDKTWLSHLD